MTRKPLVDVNEVMESVRFSYYRVEITKEAMRRILSDVVAKYEAALMTRAGIAKVLELREENADLRKKLSDMEVQNVNTEPTPGFFNAENFDTMYGIARDHERRILELERAQRGSEGEL